MKTENLYIECESLEQSNKVLEVGLNYNLYNSYPEDFIDGEQGLNVRISEGHIFTMPFDNLEKPTKLTYKQFMEKYAMQKFKEAVVKAKDKFNVDNTGLSRMLGYHRDYINEALKDGRSTKWQEKTIAKIEALSKGVVLDRITVEIDAKISPELQKIIDDTKAEVEKVVKENTQLKKDKEQLIVHNVKLVEEIEQANAINSGLQNDKAKLVTQINNGRKVVENLHSNINEITVENKEKLSSLMVESDKYFKESQKLKQEKDNLKGQIVSLEKINKQYKNKYAASVTIGLMIASALICVILWGGV